MVNSVPINDSTLNKTKVTTVILADDHPVVRKAIKTELLKEPDFEVLAEACDGEEAVKLVTQYSPDIVIMDIGMPKLNGIEATRQIKAIRPDTLVLVLTIHDDTEHVLGILESGADGYLTKNILVEDIIKAMRSASAGETVLSPLVFQQVLKYALKHIIKPIPLNVGVKLTLREQEILRALSKGKSNKQIAQELNMGVRTVKSHLVDIFSKLNVVSRTEAIIIALRCGFLNIDDMD